MRLVASHILPLSRILTWPWAAGQEHIQRSPVAPSGSLLQDTAAVAVVAAAVVVVVAAVAVVLTPANYDGWCTP